MVNLKEGMSTREVAEILGVSERTVRNICKSKQLTHYKVGTKIVVLPEDLTNYINSLKIETEEGELLWVLQTDLTRERNLILILKV